MIYELEPYVPLFKRLRLEIETFLETEESHLSKIKDVESRERAMVVFATARLLQERYENKVSTINWRTQPRTAAQIETLKLLQYQLETFLADAESELDFLRRRVSELSSRSRL